MSEVYGDKEIDAELGVVIGTITESQGIVSQALESRGGRMNMCTALEELERKGMEKGMKTGKILARYEDGMSPEEIARKMGLTVKQVEKILEENGMLTTV
ncbi:MAG: sigma-70 family RNA polymerase sigma factor [Clostridiales bacterium]|nr:sigma-70 family RNA polymerase sigma factor [Clostridiales bacterium]